MLINHQLSKKIKLIVFLFVLSSLLILPLTSVLATPGENRSGNIYIAEGLVYENVFFVAGKSLNLNAEFKDDIYIAGANVVINGPVEGDIIAVGSNVIINSEVKGNVRIAGGSVTIKGKIDKNVTVVGGMVTIEQGAEIGKNLFVGGGLVEINGKINKNLYGGAGEMILNGEIGGSAYLSIDPEGGLILLPATNIAGNLEYTAGKTADIKPGAQIQNEEKFSQFNRKQKIPYGMKDKVAGLIFVVWLVMLLGTIIVGLLVVTLLKNFILKTQKIIDKKVSTLILKGLVYLIVTPIALIILAITIIGLPLAFIIAALYFIALYLSNIIVAVFVGQQIIKLINKKAEPQLIWSMILGLVILFILFAIPVIGLISKLLVMLWGLGVLMTIIKKQLNLED